ncbi:hypothetical protein [Eleftheria terrae]|uniref:hypothetical protein n=1 Tax=Eleftheria terrae TaxID=1597781 RepID=UPI00263A50A8|nr:hypothetical protein [Eleftheria terrae]WKB55925.1 hypothetical protein N7L95_28010 [Eleftheria terrae]
MRRVFLGVALALGACGAWAGSTVSNATELRDLLRGQAQPATLEPLKSESGCGPAGCSVDLERLSIRVEPGFIQQARGARLRLVEHKHKDGPALPEIDWTPMDAYQVFNAGRRWGSCIEFSHSGMGKSGSYQRWSSVVLVPFRGERPGKTAHRFVGYWTGCDSLQAGDKPGEVVFPVVERAAEHAPAPLHLMRYQCSVQRCSGSEDARSVARHPTDEGGALVVEGQ